MGRALMVGLGVGAAFVGACGEGGERRRAAEAPRAEREATAAREPARGMEETAAEVVEAREVVEDSSGGGDAAEFVARGERVYRQFCQLCHRSGGEGMGRMAPSLVGSSVALGPVEPLIELTLLGTGPGGVERSGRYAQAMTGVWEMGDADVAAVLTYVRASWGNAGSAVTAEEVAAVRAGLEERGE